MAEPKWTPAAPIVLDSLQRSDLELFNAIEVILAEWNKDEPVETYNPAHELKMRGELEAIINDFRRNRVVRGEAAKLSARIVAEAVEKFGDARWQAYPRPIIAP